MALFAHGFLAYDSPPVEDMPGRFDELRGIRIDVDGNPVVAGPLNAGPMETKGDIDRPGLLTSLTRLSTKGNVDPNGAERRDLGRSSGTESLGPITTVADVDGDRRG